MSIIKKALLACLCSTAMGYAQKTPSVDSLNRRVAVLENDYKRAANPPLISSRSAFIEGDVLFWQARETGLEYLIDAVQPSSSFLPKEFDIKAPEFEWDFGSRVGLGYNPGWDGCDLFVQWTRFFTDAHDNGLLTASPNQSFFSPWSNPNFTIFPVAQIIEAEAHWKLHFDTIDLELGRAFFMTKFLVLRPFIGPSSIWINQRYKLEYEANGIIARRRVFKDRIKLKNFFFGLGARAGGEMNFHFTTALSLMAKGALAIYAGKFDVDRKEKMQNTLNTTTFDIDDNFRAGRAATTLAMGFRWEHFTSKKWYVRAELCYDIQFFFKQNQFIRDMAPFNKNSDFLSDKGDLSLHGGSFSLTLGF
ncbi:MAG TPA: Lpg1974 family pore-forming outer membrane protein [Rhabdochlamydiaceae bacterium]|jgi:hypothetical protein